MTPTEDDSSSPPPRHEHTPGLHGHITHADIASADPAATREWFIRVFGWKFRPPFSTPSGDYHLFAYSETGGGGVRQTAPEESPGTIPFVHVEDAHRAFELAVRAGAEPVQLPTRVMEGVTTAIVRVPGGVMIGLSGP